MADPGLGSSRVSSGAETLQRRKIRKGTQSCWECKRRKVKCTFAPPRGATCDVCKRRGILCVGQEFPQSSTTPGQVGDRLDRVEALVEHLVKSTDSTDSVELPNGQRGGLQGTLSSSTGNSVDIPPVHETVVRATCTISCAPLIFAPNTAEASSRPREYCRNYASAGAG